MITKKRALWIVVGLFVAMFAIAFVLNSIEPKPVNVWIFDDISECEAITQLSYEDAELVKYETPTADKHLKNLSYSRFFAAEYKSKEVEFEIFAYEFNDFASAQKYFENVTGIDGSSVSNFVISSGMTRSEIVVLDNERAYTVLTSRADLKETERALGELFSKKLEFENK